MSDEEEFDEFPSITVNSSIHESVSFSMPSAEELATQRARERACELALLRLREEHAADGRAPAPAPGVAPGVAHSDSSGSEGEAALAAAVGALRVRAARAGAAPHAARLLAALAPPAHRAAAQRLPAGALAERARDAARGLTRARAPLAPAELPAALAWLGAAAVGGGRAALRALHRLVDDVADDAQAEEIGTLLRGAAASLEPATALELSEALRGGGPRGAGLARDVARAALARLAGPDAAPEDAAGALPAAWRRLAPPRRYLALQLLARLLPPPGGEGGEEGEAARRLLDALAQATPPQRAQTADSLKVLVATTKLQVLFHVKK